MSRIRTVVVDDEPLARSRLIKLLSEDESIQVLGECKNGSEAVSFLRKHKPDLVFLDIQMPDLSGFDVLERLGGDAPFVVFVTAFDQYALKAFDVHAVDYLLKPFDNDRFFESIELAKRQIELKQSSEFNRKLIDLMQEYRQKRSSYLYVFEIKKNGRVIKVKVEDVQWIEAAGNYVTLYLGDEEHLYRMTMNALESELDPEQFLRVHRSITLNTRHVETAKYLRNNQYRFVMKNGDEVISGRSYKQTVMDYLSLQED